MKIVDCVEKHDKAIIFNPCTLCSCPATYISADACYTASLHKKWLLQYTFGIPIHWVPPGFS